eukprot:GHVP01027181.1.p1 GENE.GHVP01027181.1~~GHVP01027181.1.p1  ORF type:complete len:345 (-),score=62.76 GHVP01027181.1:24-1058(-)
MKEQMKPNFSARYSPLTNRTQSGVSPARGPSASVSLQAPTLSQAPTPSARFGVPPQSAAQQMQFRNPQNSGYSSAGVSQQYDLPHASPSPSTSELGKAQDQWNKLCSKTLAFQNVQPLYSADALIILKDQDGKDITIKADAAKNVDKDWEVNFGPETELQKFKYKDLQNFKQDNKELKALLDGFLTQLNPNVNNGGNYVMNVLGNKTISFYVNKLSPNEEQCRMNLRPGELAFVYPEAFMLGGGKQQMDNALKDNNTYAIKTPGPSSQEFEKTEYQLSYWKITYFRQVGGDEKFTYVNDPCSPQIFYKITNKKNRMDILEQLSKKPLPETTSEETDLLDILGLL